MSSHTAVNLQNTSSTATITEPTEADGETRVSFILDFPLNFINLRHP